METIAFYSYKGGVGRSLLLANAARFLATLGKGVVALDLDLEAPGLHYKLGGGIAGKKKPARRGGAVPYLVATAQDASSAPPLDKHLIDVPVPPESGGWLRLMPAGPAPERAYWSALKELGERLRLDDPSGRGLMAVLDLQARIQDELKPDYLLIDARTGVTEIGALATTILADAVVCMFVANQESLDGTVTVTEALKTAPRLKGQAPVRVVPLLSRLVEEKPPRDERFAGGLRRLLELGVGKAGSGKVERELFVLPHDAALGASERVVGGDRKASAFSPLYKAYLELFQTLFPSGAEEARRALERLEAVADVRAELTREPRRPFGFEDRLRPWSDSAITEGVSSDAAWGSPHSRYADLVCRNDAGRPLMVVEYIAEGSEAEAVEFWKRPSDVRCVVLLDRSQRGHVERHVHARDRSGTLRRIERWDLPFPAEFDLFPDLGDRSVEAMLDALRQGRAEAVAWLIDEWRQSMGGFTGRREPIWRPERARRILDGLAAMEDLRTAEEILRRCSANWSPPWPPERWHMDRMMFEFPLEEPNRRLEDDLFAPLFWRLPIEAVREAMRPTNYPGETLSLAGYRLLASHLLGLNFDPYRTALDEGRVLAERFTSLARPEEGDEWLPMRWLGRSLEILVEQLQLSDELPPTLVWEEHLRQHPYRLETLEQARDTIGVKARKQMTAPAGLRRRLRTAADRRELATQGLLGEYDASGRITLYSAVIEATAELLGLPPRHLKSVAFIHLSVRALAHQARDLDGQPGYGFAPTPQTSPLERESPVHVSLVQAFTHRFILRLEDPNLLAAFEKLTPYQPEPYRRWTAMQSTPLELLRALLMRARVSEAIIGLPGTGEFP